MTILKVTKTLSLENMVLDGKTTEGFKLTTQPF